MIEMKCARANDSTVNVSTSIEGNRTDLLGELACGCADMLLAMERQNEMAVDDLAESYAKVLYANILDVIRAARGRREA